MALNEFNAGLVTIMTPETMSKVNSSTLKHAIVTAALPVYRIPEAARPA